MYSTDKIPFRVELDYRGSKEYTVWAHSDEDAIDIAIDELYKDAERADLTVYEEVVDVEMVSREKDWDDWEE